MYLSHKAAAPFCDSYLWRGENGQDSKNLRVSPNRRIQSKLNDLNLGLFCLVCPKSLIGFQSKMARNISESLKGKKRPRETDTEAETSDIDQILSLGMFWLQSHFFTFSK